MRDLVRYVKAITPIAGSHTKVSRGPNGSRIDGTPVAKNSARESKDLFPWHIVSDTREETVNGAEETVNIRVFADCYYMAGQIMLKYTPDADEEAVEDFVCQGDLDEGEEYTADDRPFVAFRYVSGTSQSASSEEEIVGYKTYDLMLSDMRDRTKTVIPLYLFTHDGGVKLDFRSIPSSQEFEIV